MDAGLKGCFVFTSSASAVLPSPFAVSYASTKAFLSMFAISLAPEVKWLGIDVLAVHPSPVASKCAFCFLCCFFCVRVCCRGGGGGQRTASGGGEQRQRLGFPNQANRNARARKTNTQHSKSLNNTNATP